MDQPKKYSTVEEYMQSFEGVTATRLGTLRALIKDMLPSHEEKISYNIPAYFVDGKRVIYFAGYESHVSLYPGRVLDQEYMKLMLGYTSGKSTLKFPNNKDLPLDLIRKFIKLRIKEATGV